ncbi:5'-methylthioadenosine/adenosylhomocysteine nucleosidase [Wenyingzhuangia sp. IMCC45467]
MIGIISAMHDELSELLDLLQDKKTKIIGNRTYYTGNITNQKVVIVFSKWGKVAAAITTTELISTFHVSQIIFSGVAGAINPLLNIGDIVYGTSLLQHDMDASPLFPKFEIPLLGKSTITTTNDDKLFDCVQEFNHQYYDYISSKEAQQFNIDKPKVIKGLIASGDEFINSNIKLKQLQNDIPNLQCVEMEGAAVAQVCEEYKIPFSIIRIISDKANQSAHIDFPAFTKLIASKYAKGILENYCS